MCLYFETRSWIVNLDHRRVWANIVIYEIIVIDIYQNTVLINDEKWKVSRKSHK